jgi:hypothetical protein
LPAYNGSVNQILHKGDDETKTVPAAFSEKGATGCKRPKDAKRIEPVSPAARCQKGAPSPAR